MTASTTATAPKKHAFKAEVSEVLKLVIHSLYSHREIFLRELISNASDALDKLRFRALTEPALLEGEPALEIRLRIDEAKQTLSIEDTGVGMTEEELVANLGTVAHSGSRAFLELAAKSQASAGGAKDLNLIGKFGVGFYSAFLVADRVDVVTRAGGAQHAFAWSSNAEETFTVAPATRTRRGTEVVLHFRDEHKEMLDSWTVRDLVRRYSDFVAWPIKVEVIPEAKGGEPKPEPTWEQLNRASALWQRPKTEITEAQYEELYRHLSHDFEPPLAHTHFRVEGTQEFVGLLYLPKRAPFDLHDRDRRGVRLFVRRVFIMDDCDALVPQWLRFVRGVVDSDDLPLNVSRELLQDSKTLAAIKKQVVKKTLDLLDELAKDKADAYAEFWKAFGVVLKEGLALDAEYKDRLGALVRFQSSQDEVAALTSLGDYKARMPTDQSAIYYVVGQSRKALESSPHVEALRAKGYEVLYMTDPVDEWAVQGLSEFEGKKLVSAMEADLKLEETEDQKTEKERVTGQIKPLLERMQKVLCEKVRDVKVSDRLTDSPCCLVSMRGAASPFVEQLLKERGRAMPRPKRVLEINPKHPLTESLEALLAHDAASPNIDEWIALLYDQALLAEGSVLEDPAAFARRVSSLLTRVTMTEREALGRTPA